MGLEILPDPVTASAFAGSRDALSLLASSFVTLPLVPLGSLKTRAPVAALLILRPLMPRSSSVNFCLASVFSEAYMYVAVAGELAAEQRKAGFEESGFFPLAACDGAFDEVGCGSGIAGVGVGALRTLLFAVDWASLTGALVRSAASDGCTLWAQRSISSRPASRVLIIFATRPMMMRHSYSVRSASVTCAAGLILSTYLLSSAY